MYMFFDGNAESLQTEFIKYLFSHGYAVKNLTQLNKMSRL